MKKNQTVSLILFLALICCYGDIVIKRDWEFESSKKVSFSISDTCEITVEFTGVIPPDFLVGYTRLGLQIDDSLRELPDSVSPLYRISFDAGFLNFSHVLTCTFKYDSGLFDLNVDISSLKCMQDPYPVAKLHFWRDCDSFFIDKINQTFGFSYRVIGKNENLEKTKNIKIASTDYPFDFGIVKKSESFIKITNRNPVNGKSDIHKFMVGIRSNGYHTENNAAFYSLLGRSLIKGGPGASGQYIHFLK